MAENGEGDDDGSVGAEGQAEGQGNEDAQGGSQESGQGNEGGEGEGSQAGEASDIGTVLASEEWIKHVPSAHLPTASKYKSLDAFLNAHGELNGKLGEALFLPGKDASDEDRGKFFDRLGRPKAADGYKAPEIEGVEFDPDQMSSFFEAAHNAGLSQGQAEALVTWQANGNKDAVAQTQAAHVKAHKALDTEWGDEAAANYEMARRTATAALGEAGMKALGLGDDPQTWPVAAVKAMHTVAPSFADSRHIHRAGRDADKADDALLAEADELMMKPDKTEADQARIDQIYEGVYGTEPIGPGAAAP